MGARHSSFPVQINGFRCGQTGQVVEESFAEPQLSSQGKVVHTAHIHPLHGKGSRKEDGLVRKVVRWSGRDMIFDTIGILPLFGDGQYSVGYVVPI